MTAPRALDAAEACGIASGDPVRSAFERLGPMEDFGRLLASDEPSDPAKVLAAEQIAHLVQGWQYCAAAFHALLVHAPDNAQHFAYYAELRAALSLFAGSGIRVKQGGGYCLDAQAERRDLKKQTTHKLAWNLWRSWVKGDDALALLGGQITLLPGVAIEDFRASLAGLGDSHSLEGWGYDLLSVEEDHNARNAASYDALWATRSLKRMTRDDLNVLAELWELLLPEEGTRWRFDVELIRFLVRRALPVIRQCRSDHEPEEDVESGEPNPTLSSEDADLRRIVRQVAERTGAEADRVMRILAGNSIVRPFSRAEEQNTAVVNMLCRAVFLIRLATLSVRQRMPRSSTAVQVWFAKWLEHAGLRDSASEVEVADLAEDWRSALQTFSPQPPLPQTLWDEQNARQSALLSRADVCLAWGVLA